MQIYSNVIFKGQIIMISLISPHCISKSSPFNQGQRGLAYHIVTYRKPLRTREGFKQHSEYIYHDHQIIPLIAYYYPMNVPISPEKSGHNPFMS